MKRIFLGMIVGMAVCSASAATRNYLCAITQITVDTLASNSKNQFTLNWTQQCKNTAEYTGPNAEKTYTTTVKLVINSDDRTLEGTYTTEGADPDHSSANVNDQTINLVTSELYYGNTRRLLRTDSVSTFTIVKLDDNRYAVTGGRLCFTAAAINDRNKDTYNYHYAYAQEELLEEGIMPVPFEFDYKGGYQQSVAHYDMNVASIAVEHSNTDYNATRYFVTLNCSGTDRETGAARPYEVQLALYPTAEALPAEYATKGSSEILMAINSYVMDLDGNRLRYLTTDSLSTVRIEDLGNDSYRFFGGTLICVDLDANYSAVYGKKRVEAVHYYHFPEDGVTFVWNEQQAANRELTPTDVSVTERTAAGLIVGYELNVSAQADGVGYEVFLDLETDRFTGSFTPADGTLTLWSKVMHGTVSSYITSDATLTLSKSGTNLYTLSATLPCENGNTYVIPSYEFEYEISVPTEPQDFTLDIDTVVITYMSNLSDSLNSRFIYTFDFSAGDDYPNVLVDVILSQPMQLVEGAYSLTDGTLSGLTLARDQSDFEMNIFAGGAYEFAAARLTLSTYAGQTWRYVMLMQDIYGNTYHFDFVQQPHIILYPAQEEKPEDIPFADESKEQTTQSFELDKIDWNSETVDRDGIIDIILSTSEPVNCELSTINYQLTPYIHLGMYTPVAYPEPGTYPVNGSEENRTFSASLGRYGNTLIPCYVVLLDDEGWAHAVWYIVSGTITLDYDENQQPRISGDCVSHFGSRICFSYNAGAQGLDPVTGTPSAVTRKFLRDGVIRIERNGRTYDLNGRMMK